MAGYASPEAAVRAAFASLAVEDWDGFVALVHPLDMARFREEEVERLRRYVKDQDVQRPETQQLFDTLFGAGSPEELDALPPKEVLRRWLAPRHSEPPASAEYEPPSRSRELVGGVQEAAGLWHFVYRLTLRARYGVARLHHETLEVMTSRQGPDGWYVVPNPDVTNNDMARMVLVDQPDTPPEGASFGKPLGCRSGGRLRPHFPRTSSLVSLSHTPRDRRRPWI
ncbi:MAG TPA: hypothetical protein VIG08_03390 [Gemmatimonadales bacterium]|jgi:hypothetical protein